MKKVLIIGASSFIGCSIATYLRKDYRVYGTYFRNRPQIDGVPMLQLQIARQTPLESFLKMLSPDAVIYCAAQVADDEIAKDPLGAMFINAECPAWMGKWLSDRGSRFIFLSSSKVFSGLSGDYVETSSPDATGSYGASKRQAEEWLSTTENTFIIRLGTLYGLGSSDQKSAMFNRVLAGIWSQKTLQFIDDEYRSFFCVDELAKALAICLDAEVSKTYIYHLSNNEKHSYFQFAKAVARVFGLYSEHLVPISGKSFHTAEAVSGGPRGTDLSLNGELFSDTFSKKFPSLEVSLLHWRNKLRLGKQ
jgi:dTDP-4-dehydrorhamnose reductase